MSDRVAVPHFAFPLRLDSSGSMAVVAQDTPDEIAQCVEILLRTPLGSRLEVPEYGTVDSTFVTEIDMATIRSQIERWEPRATVTTLVTIQALDELIREIMFRVSSERRQ